MAKLVTATDLRTRIREVIQRAQFQGDHVIVTVFDKPAAVIIGIEDYRNYVAWLEGKKRPRVMAEKSIMLNELSTKEFERVVMGTHKRALTSRNHKSANRDGRTQHHLK